MPERIGLLIGSGFARSDKATALSADNNRFGAPSAVLYLERRDGIEIVSLNRHGEKHSIPPHAINYRANLLALAEAGVARVVALCTVGIISDICAPGQLGVPDQILDYTWGREQTIYDGSDGVVEHIEFTEPFSAGLRQDLLAAADNGCHDGGVYAATQGPRLESAAEVRRLARDGADYVGMTAMPEAAIALELGMQYACLALVVNRAAGLGSQSIHAELEASTNAARDAAGALLERFFAAANHTRNF